MTPCLQKLWANGLTWPPAGERSREVPVSDRGSPLITVRSHVWGTLDARTRVSGGKLTRTAGGQRWAHDDRGDPAARGRSASQIRE
jgi:hypothetical protein